MAYDNEKITGIMEQVFQTMPQLLDDVENNSYGDPQKIISWTNLSLCDISSLLKTSAAGEI